MVEWQNQAGMRARSGVHGMLSQWPEPTDCVAELGSQAYLGSNTELRA